MDALKQGADALFILLGAIMVLAMHAGFAFLELGTVRKKNQVNALVKILVDFSVSTIVYFLVGYGVAYGTHFFVSATELSARSGYDLMKFFFLLTFAAAIPAIISGGIAERAKFWPQLIATAVIVGLIYPFFEGIAWNKHFGIQDWIASVTGHEFHDFAGSRCRPCCCWARGATATAATARWPRIRRRTSRSSRSAPGCCAWAGSAST